MNRTSSAQNAFPRRHDTDRAELPKVLAQSFHRMAFQIPIGRIQSLPDSVKARMPRNSCRPIQLLRSSGAAGERYGCRRHDHENESMVQSKLPYL